MVPGGDEEHTDHVEESTEDPVLPGDHHEEGGQGNQVGSEEGERREPVGSVDSGRRIRGRGADRRGNGCSHGWAMSPTGWRHRDGSSRHRGRRLHSSSTRTVVYSATYRSPFGPAAILIGVRPAVAGPRISAPVLALNSDPWQGQAMSFDERA